MVTFHIKCSHSSYFELSKQFTRKWGIPVFLITAPPYPREAFWEGVFPKAPYRPCILISRNSDRWLSSLSVPWYVSKPGQPSLTVLTPNLCFSCRTPTAAAVTLTHFDPSASAVGLWVNRKEREKKSRQPFGILMRPSPFHYVVISYFTALTVTAQEASKGLSALHAGCWAVAGWGRGEKRSGWRTGEVHGPTIDVAAHGTAEAEEEEGFP